MTILDISRAIILSTSFSFADMISYSAESCNPEFEFRNCTIEGGGELLKTPRHTYPTNGIRSAPRRSLIFLRGGRGGDEGWRERAADIFAKHGEIAAKMKSALGPGTTISFTRPWRELLHDYVALDRETDRFAAVRDA